MFAVRRHHSEKVLTVSCRLDLISKQLDALNCGELFLVEYQGFTTLLPSGP